MSTTITRVLVIRDPDWENEYVVEGGEVETIDVDLGASFDGPKHFDASSEEGREWIADVRERVAHLDPDRPIRSRVEELIATLSED